MWEERLHGRKSHGSLAVMMYLWWLEKLVTQSSPSKASGSCGHHPASNEKSSKICRGSEHPQPFLRKEAAPYTRLLHLLCSPAPSYPIYYRLRSFPSQPHTGRGQCLWGMHQPHSASQDAGKKVSAKGGFLHRDAFGKSEDRPSPGTVSILRQPGMK